MKKFILNLKIKCNFLNQDLSRSDFGIDEGKMIGIQIFIN
jgi:hypothetical protein